MSGTAPSRRITICQICRKRVRKQRNGAWYHDRNSSESCYFGSGSSQRAVPLEITIPAEPSTAKEASQ